MRYETKEQRRWREHWENKRFNDDVAAWVADASRLVGPPAWLRDLERKTRRDIDDARTLKIAERAGDTTRAAALRARMTARNLGVDV